LRDNQSISLDSVHCDYDFTLTLCNVRSLRKHISDLKNDKAFTCSNVILCTETQLVSECHLDDVALHGFNLICNNDSQHRFSSLAVFYDNNMSLVIKNLFLGQSNSIIKVKTKIITTLLLLFIIITDLF